MDTSSRSPSLVSAELTWCFSVHLFQWDLHFLYSSSLPCWDFQCLSILGITTGHDRGKKIKCNIDAAHLQPSWRNCVCFPVSRRCFLYSCPQSKPRISFFHKVLPPLPLPLSHYQTASWAVKCFTGFSFSFERGRQLWLWLQD